MKNLLRRHWKSGLSVLLGIVVWLFWAVAYPHALSYHEQYQLFLWSGDYLSERLLLPGGFADWLSEFLVQFFLYPWLGGLLLSLLFVGLQCFTARLLPKKLYVLSFAVPLFVWWLMGDINVMVALPVALVSVLGLACVRWPRQFWWLDVLVMPLAWWLFGPAACIYGFIRLLQYGWPVLSGVASMAVCVVLTCMCLPQWPVQQLLSGISYYRIPLGYPQLSGYNSDMYELIRQDYLIRNERWDELIKRAEEHVVHTTFWSNSVNLALSQKRQLAERQFRFYQSGDDALIMGSVRDLTSNLPTAEAFYRLGMINSAQRYMFDIQESILNAKKSGRCTKRIAECMLINGHYKPAAKQLNLLKQTLFYRDWAEQMEQCLYKDSMLERIPEYKRLRQLRFKDDFLYSYPELEKIFAMLFVNNQDNKMALDYFLAQLLLKGQVQQFMQYLQWAQQYGGYKYMPEGYQDAVRCIQSQGRQGGSYGQYVQRQLKKGGAK